MSPNTGECIVNSPVAGEYIEFNYDQYDEFSQWSKNAVTKKREKMVYSGVSKLICE
jgi:hypothetical protein